MRGTLRLAADALVLERGGSDQPTRIPLESIERTGVESTFGVLPALHVWHTVAGREVLSRFEFGSEDEESGPPEPGGVSDRVGPGLARDAAQRLEGGLRALTGGLQQSRRVARQAVEGIARQDEYRRWPAAIAQAQQEAALRHGSAHSVAAPEPAAIIPPDTALPVGDTATQFRWFRERALTWLAACGERARALAVPGIPVIQPWYPLDSPICRIVVAGEFSRGKSTLINALFGIHGEIALPTGMTPTTPLACAIRVPQVGETDGATITYRGSRAPLQLSLDEFRAGVRLAEEGAQGEGAPTMLHLEEARRVEVRVTGAYLPGGVEIEDTPGLAEQAGRSAGAMSALGRADLILFVLAADQLLSDLERETIDRTILGGHHRNVLFLVNFWENIEDEAQRALVRQRAETLLRAVPRVSTGQDVNADSPDVPPIFYISALQAARAQRRHQPAPEESGVPALRAALRQLLGPQSAMLLLRSRAGRALRYTELLRQAVSRAAAATIAGTGGMSGGKPSDHGAAAATATRLLEGLDGAIQGATARHVTALREMRMPGLQRVAALLESGDITGARRALTMELRGAAGACASAAQGALDLVLAQVRASFMERGLPPPPLEGHIEATALWDAAEGQDLDPHRPLDEVADEVARRLRATAETLRATLLETLRAATAEAASTRARAEAATPGPSREARQRRAALLALEDDLVRLQRLVQPLLQYT